MQIHCVSSGFRGLVPAHAPRNDETGKLLYIIAMATASTIRLQREPFDAAAESAALTRGRGDVGAVVTFTGICRGEEADEPIAALTLEHYPGMAEAEIERHVAEAVERWPLKGVTVIHRYGRIAPGEDIVLVVTASAHRQAAFAAAEFLMDYLKTCAPFWKQVERADGTSWVDAKAVDNAAAERWSATRRKHEAAE
jgi:molybdopterin synthase catalytic subunit